jgi:general stress protein YciG
VKKLTAGFSFVDYDSTCQLNNHRRLNMANCNNNNNSNNNNSDTSKRGFASMDEGKQKRIASKGGKASGGNFKNDRQKAREAGRKGGKS